MALDGYQKGKQLKQHPFGNMYRIYKDEYQIHFEKCIIEGTISQELFQTIHQLKHKSQIVEYETQDKYIVLENVSELPSQLSSLEVKKMIIDMFHAVQILQEYHISLTGIQINQIYKTKNHYKLDCYNIGNKDYKELIQDICQIGIDILGDRDIALSRILHIFINKKYQKDISQMILVLERTKITNQTYHLTTYHQHDDRKDKFFTVQLPYYIAYNYLLYIIILILIFILIFI